MGAPLPFPLALNIGTDIVHIPRIARLLTRRTNNLTRFTRRILTDPEQADFRARFPPSTSTTQHSSRLNPSPSPSPSPRPSDSPLTADMARWLAGRFAAKEAARKAAPNGAAAIGWKDVWVRVGGKGEGEGEATGRPEVVYATGTGSGGVGEGRVGKLSISHDGEYVVATVLAAG